MSDLQKNLTAAGASAESAEKIAGIIKGGPSLRPHPR